MGEVAKVAKVFMTRLNPGGGSRLAIDYSKPLTRFRYLPYEALKNIQSLSSLGELHRLWRPFHASRSPNKYGFV